MNIKVLTKRLINEPASIVEVILRKPSIAKFIPDKLAIKIFYYLRFRRFPNLERPTTFNEKLLWLTLNDRKPIYTSMVDKYEAKLYIKDLLVQHGYSDNIIVPTYGVYNTFSEIDFSSLPSKFVMKTTHDSGSVILVKDKSKLDLVNARRVLNISLKNNYFWFSREWPYRNVRPRIIIEKYIDNGDSTPPDYKVHCFNGLPLFVGVVNNRFSDLTWTYYNVDRSPMDLKTWAGGKPGIHILPEQLTDKWDKML